MTEQLPSFRQAAGSPVRLPDDVSWKVLTDPEGTQFCVLGPA